MEDYNFKIGDKVRIVKNLYGKNGTQEDIWIPYMDVYIGHIDTIKCPDPNYSDRFSLNNIHYFWYARYLELVKEEKQEEVKIEAKVDNFEDLYIQHLRERLKKLNAEARENNILFHTKG